MAKGLVNVDLFISDWSGVISDDRRPVYEANMHLFDSLGMRKMTFEEWLPGTTTTPKGYLDKLGMLWGEEIIFEKYTEALATVKDQGIHPTIYCGAKDFLECVSRRRPVIVVSSHPETHLQEEATRYELSRYVSRFVGSVKDKAKEISDIVGCHGTECSKTIYIGDTIHDIRAAKEAGVVSLAIATGYDPIERLIEENPNILVGSLSSLFKILDI